MDVTVIGAGPAGLYLKMLNPTASIQSFEQNPADAIFGFGVVFSDRVLQLVALDESGNAERKFLAQDVSPRIGDEATAKGVPPRVSPCRVSPPPSGHRPARR